MLTTFLIMLAANLLAYILLTSVNALRLRYQIVDRTDETKKTQEHNNTIDLLMAQLQKQDAMAAQRIQLAINQAVNRAHTQWMLAQTAQQSAPAIQTTPTPALPEQHVGYTVGLGTSAIQPLVPPPEELGREV